MSIVYDPLYNSFSERKVFKCRITVHTLGRQVEDEQSENHVVINLLIGNRQSVRVDMTVRNLENEGSLVLKLYNYTTSTSAIKAVDISTRGCPTHFNPDAPILNVEHGLTVQDFVSTIVDSDYHMFRFLVVGEASLGCRYWVLTVISAFLSAGHFSRPDALDTGNPSFRSLIAHKWDRTRSPRRLTVVPGIIGLAEERFSRLEIAPLLATAESFALLLLAQAMVNSRRDVDSRILAIQSATEVQRSHIVWLMVEHLEDRDWEIVTDLIAQPNVWGMLVISLRGRYATAVRAIETASQLHLSSAERYWSSQFALLLAATVDMAGEEDE